MHLDTDLGGDADDLCALAMLLGDRGVELAGITTCADVTGQRAEFVRHALRLAGREAIPVAAGAAGFLGGMAHEPGNQDGRYWPEFDFAAPLERDAGGAALELLGQSVAAGAAVIAIGPYTNLALFETMRPGELLRVPVTLMGGYFGAPKPGYPHWGPNMDYNVQADRVAARLVYERMHPLIVPLLACFDATLRQVDVPALEAGGPLARLIARQGQLQRKDSRFDRLAQENPALPADMLNFHWDPLACAAALGWECVEVSEAALELVEREGQLLFEELHGAPVRRVVSAVDADRFRREWLERVVRV